MTAAFRTAKAWRCLQSTPGFNHRRPFHVGKPSISGVLQKRTRTGLQEDRAIAPVTKLALSGDRYEECANDYIAFDVKGPVMLRMKDENPWNLKPMLVQSLLRNTVNEYPDWTALASKENGPDGPWSKWTYKEYLEAVQTVAKAFIALGLEETHAVGIVGSSCAQWAISSVGAIFAGGLSCGIYTTSNNETVAHICRNADVDILVLENIELLMKYLNSHSHLKSFLPGVKCVVLMESTVSGISEVEKTCPLLSWSDLLAFGRQQSMEKLNDRELRQAVNKACTLVYTSGTTGHPKGAMLSHDNVTFSAQIMADTFTKARSEEHEKRTLLSFLPLSHVTPYLIDIYCSIYCAGATYFADKNALKGTLVQNLKEVKPAKILAVPRVWEKIKDKIQEQVASASPVRRAVFNWALDEGRKHSDKILSGKLSYGDPGTVSHQMAHRLVLTRIHEALGLQNTTRHCSSRVTGASAIHPETLKFFRSLGLFICEGYGSTETCAGVASILEDSNHYQFGSVGRAIPGCLNTILEPDPSTGEGEIASYSRGVVMGYAKEEEKTREAFTEGGFLRSGDVGLITSDGFLKITGRIKELIITEGGKNIAPVPIENAIQSQLSDVVSHVMVVGDNKKFLTCLLTLKVEVDPSTNIPSDRLDPISKAWCTSTVKKLGKVAATETVDDFINGPQANTFASKVQAAIDAANSIAESHACQVKKFTILPKDFSVPSGELGPTLKLRRFYAASKFEEEINAMYA